MIRIVYVSSAVRSLGDTEIQAIVESSKESNRLKNITGMLLYHNGCIIQALEGPAEAVEALFELIEKDERHVGVIRLLREPMGEREFADWDMGCIRGAGLTRESATEIESGHPSGKRAHALLRSFASRAR